MSSPLVIVRQYILAAVACLAMVASPCRAASLGCAHDRCGLLADGSYQNLVIGRLVHVGTAKDMVRVYRWAKSHGYWQSLPDTPSPYLHDLKLVTIALPRSIAKRPVTVFMQTEEYADAPLSVGALVRYSPHGVTHKPPAHADAAELSLYHGLTGCVATICVRHDTACFKRYSQGVFTKAKGKPVNVRTGTPVVNGASIDPVSLLPRHTHGRANRLKNIGKGQ